MKVYRCLAAMLLLFAWPLSHAATTQYYYDDLGRIVQAVRSDGAVFQYQYDANGNVLAINRISAASVSIANFSPPIGHAGATVTISGTGFSATPSQNTVTFAGGAAAVVNAASATVLTVTVPQAAQTGPVSVTVNGSTATSAMSYVVRKPVIQSFAPAAVSPGGQVTVTGSNLSLVPTGTGVSVGSSAVTLVSVGNSQLIFNAPATSGSGPIHVNTSYGNASSASNLVVVPNAIGVANVVATAELAVGGAAQAIDIAQANRFGIFTFAATQGQYLSVQLSAFVATPSFASFAYALYSPTNAVVATGNVAASQRTIHLPRIPTSGTYLLSFSGSGTVQLTARLELNPDFTLDGGTLPVSTDFAPQSKRITFAATAGESLGVALTTLAVAPSSGNVIFNVAGPDGFFIPAYNFNCSAGAPACQMELANLPATGTYVIVVAPNTAATMSFTLRLTRHLTGTLALNTPQTIQLQSGQYTALTFNAAAGQTLVLVVSGIATVPANNWVLLRVFAPNGSQVGFFNNPTAATVNLPNLAAGTYRIFMQTFNAATATMQMTLQ